MKNTDKNTTKRWKMNDEETLVEDGHHRAVAAMDAGRPIPYEHWRDDG